MDGLIGQIIGLTKQSRLIPAEEVITRVLLPFEEVLPEKLSEPDIEKYEKNILGLLHVNSGCVSLQCATRIATCLISLYSMQQTPKLWNLFTVVTKKPTTTGILVIGYVVDRIGEHSRSMIPGLVKIILSYQNDLFSTLFALNASFRKVANELKPYSDKTFLLIKRALQTKDEATQLIAIQTLVSVYPTEVIVPKKINLLVNDVLANTSNSAFVIDHICYFISYCAYYPLRNKQITTTKIDDFAMNSKTKKDNENGFEASFEILVTYKSHFSSILRHFLEFLTPNFIFENLSLLFNFVKKNQPSEISQLLSLFGRDVRGELFEEIAAEPNPSAQQQHLLRLLAFDDATNSEIAALSLQLTTNSSSAARLSGASFFSFLAEKNPKSAKTYLSMAVLYLSCPPEDNPTLDRDIYGMALIASHIIGASEKRRMKLINSVADNINTFLARAYQCRNVYSSEFIATFMLLAVLPPKFVHPKKCAKMIQLFNDNFNTTTITLKQIKAGSQYVASFLATHPQIEGNGRFLEQLAQIRAAHTYTTTLCAIIAATEACLVQKIATSYFIPQMLAVTPSRQYILSNLSAPMLSSQELLHHIKFDMPHMDLLYFKVSDSYFAFRAVEFFPNLILSLDENFAAQILVGLLTNLTNPLMSHSLLLSVLTNVATQSYIPPNLTSFILPLLEDEYSDVLRLQVTAECAAVWASICEQAFSDVLEFISSHQGIGKCFTYASLFNYIQLNDATIIGALHDLDEMAKLPQICPYALFALSTLFSSHALRLSELTIADMQFPFLLSIFHSKLSLSPYNLYLISNAFVKLLAIISPEIKGSIAEPYVRLLVQSFSSTPLPFSRQIKFHTMRSVFAFAKEFADLNSMVFPTEIGTSSSLQIAACGAFADMLKVRCNETIDLFPLIPTLLVLLQKRADDRITDLIHAIAIQFAAKDEEECSVEEISEWTRILKSVLTNSSLPGLQIEASIPVKRVCSLACSSVLDALVKKSPLLNECLDDLMTSSTRAIETEDEEITINSYKFLCSVLAKFNNVRTENNLLLLELYDSQFAIAIRYGFGDDLYETGEFLINYLTFHTQNLIERPENFSTVLNGYAEGIKECEDKCDYYFEISSKLCKIARHNKIVYEKIKGVLRRLEEEFAELVDESISILSNENPDPVTISVFRANKSSYYAAMLVAHIWLRSVLNVKKDENSEKLVNFLSKEIQRDSEEWRTTAAVEAVTCLLGFSIVDSSLIEKAVSAVVDLKSNHHDLFKEILPQFLSAVSKQNLDKRSELWKTVISLSLEDQDCFSCRTTALLLGRDPPDIEVENIVKKIYEFGKSDNETMALLTILIRVSWKVQLSLILPSKFENSFKMKLLTRILKTVDNIDGFSAQLALAYFRMFKKGGMNDLAAVLISNPKIAYEILNVDNFKRICELCVSDTQNAPVFLQFLLLVLEKCEKFDDKSLHELMRCAMKCVALEGSDPQKGREIVDHSVRIINFISSQKENLMRNMFAEMSQREQQILIQLTEKQAAKVKSRQNAINLKQFSNIPKKITGGSSDEEWETLEVDDND